MAKENGQQPEIALRAEQVSKIFPGTVALDHVDFNVYRGKVNVLIGENGAGKSTLMKIIAGVEQQTSGTIWLEGKAVRFNSPLQAAKAGIGIIYQELDLFPNLSVASNIFAARGGGAVINKRAEQQRTQTILAQLEQNIAPDTLVQDLPLGQQQIVAIARALAQDARILIMDEPTSALSATEVNSLFRVIRDLTNRGVSIVYISHKLEELMRIGDYITVLRDGKLQAEAKANEINLTWIIEKMIGRRPETASSHEAIAKGRTLLEARDITLPRAGGGFLVDRVSLSVAAGEVVGIYGLMGAGRTELFECLIGLHPESSGSVQLDGHKLRGSVAQRIEHGLMLVPEDRQRAGLVQTLSVSQNMTLASLRALVEALVVLSGRVEKTRVQAMIDELHVKVFSPKQPITALSGGNQQKVVVGKALLTTPKVLLLDEPTRGIDVGAKAEIFHIMHSLAEKGLGVVFVSSELNEVLLNAERILVMSKGKLTGQFSRAEASEEKLVSASSAGL